MSDYQKNVAEIFARIEAIDTTIENRNDEIERLRSRNIETVYQENRALEEEIERLGELIEELEKALGETLNMRREIIDKVLAGEHCHIITTDQIREAWEDRWTDERGNVHLWASHFDIVRCEGCGGSGKVPRMDVFPFRHHKTDCPDCAEWGSEGFLIGGGDE